MQQLGHWDYANGAHLQGVYPGQAGYAEPISGPRPPEGKAPTRGKGFEARMGDRAFVKPKFSTEQRSAKVGKGTVDGEVIGAADEYGADILLGGGGMVRNLRNI
jgi:hypothetical protein